MTANIKDTSVHETEVTVELLASESWRKSVAGGSPGSAQSAIPAAIVVEYDICCQQLRSVLKKESTVGFLCVCCAISVLSTRLRPLHKQEIVAAVKLNKSMCGEESGHFCLSVSNQMMVEDSNGVVDFAHPKMRQFLQAFHIRGIDVSHRTIARICKMQKDLDTANFTGEFVSFDPTVHVNSPFSAYAAEYWQVHQKEAYGRADIKNTECNI